VFPKVSVHPGDEVVTTVISAESSLEVGEYQKGLALRDAPSVQIATPKLPSKTPLQKPSRPHPRILDAVSREVAGTPSLPDYNDIVHGHLLSVDLENAQLSHCDACHTQIAPKSFALLLCWMQQGLDIDDYEISND
jgi:hypothetical protein